MEQNQTKKIGPIIFTLVIILIVIFAVLYIFASRTSVETIPTDATMINVQESTTSVKTISNTSDDPASLQADLEASTKGLSK